MGRSGCFQVHVLGGPNADPTGLCVHVVECPSLLTTTVKHTGLVSLDLSHAGALRDLDASGCTSLSQPSVENCTSLASLKVAHCSSLQHLDLSGAAAVRSLNLSGCTTLLLMRVVVHRRTLRPMASSLAETQVLAAPLKKHKAVVVGAGPAGALAAMYLAKRGYQVDVFERRGGSVPPPSSRLPGRQADGSPLPPPARAAHTYPMAINGRSVIGLHEVGADQLPMFQTPRRGIYFNGFGMTMSGKPLSRVAPPAASTAVTQPVGETGTASSSSSSSSSSSAPNTPNTLNTPASASGSLTSSSSSSSSSSGSRSSGSIGTGTVGDGAKGDVGAEPVMYTVERISLGQQMIDAAVELYGKDISFHFDQRLVGVDFDRRQASFGSSISGERTDGGSGGAVNVPYDLLIGADGASSSTRTLLKGGPPLVPNFLEHKPAEFVYHYHNTKLAAPAIILNIADNGTVSGQVNRVTNWEDPALESTLITAYPTLPKIWIQQAMVQFQGQDAHLAGKNIRCSKLHGDRVVLLGDSGHAVTSMLGQGCNMALESVRVFNQVLDDTGDDLDLAPALYTKRRLADVHALQKLEFMECVSGKLDCKPIPLFQKVMSMLIIKLSLIVSVALSKQLVLAESKAVGVVEGRARRKGAGVMPAREPSLCGPSGSVPWPDPPTRRPPPNLELRLPIRPSNAMLEVVTWLQTGSVPKDVSSDSSDDSDDDSSVEGAQDSDATTISGQAGNEQAASRRALRLRSISTVTCASAQTKPMPKQKAVVIGAGPAGTLAAMYLAKRGYQVDVFERRSGSAPSTAASPSGCVPSKVQHTYPMSISMRGVIGLREVGADKLPMLRTEMKGVAFNGKVMGMGAPAPAATATPTAPGVGTRTEAPSVEVGKFVAAAPPSGAGVSTDPGPSYIVDRIALGQQMVEAARSLYAGNIAFHFDQQLTSVDFDGRSAVFGTPPKKPSLTTEQQGESQTPAAGAVEYDLLVGADGANSRTQALLKAQDPSLTVETRYESLSTYKAISGLAMDPGGPPLLPGFHLHKPSEYIYFHRTSGMPGLVFFIVEDGTVSAMVSGCRNWEDPALAESLIAAYPTVPKPWIQQAVEQMKGQEPSAFGRNIRCSKLHGDRVVLLGDSGHAVTSVLGQGCNMALESVRAFNQVLDDTGDDLDLAPALYTKRRLADVHALQKLEFMEAVSMLAPSSAISLLDKATSLLTTRLQLLVSVVLCKLLPATHPAPGYRNLLKDPCVPFSSVRGAVLTQAVAGGAFLLLVVAAVGLAVAGKGATA
ncbi:MAG: hypothetical protein WDW36_002504 [Sanguina aurantia]